MVSNHYYYRSDCEGIWEKSSSFISDGTAYREDKDREEKYMGEKKSFTRRILRNFYFYFYWYYLILFIEYKCERNILQYNIYIYIMPQWRQVLTRLINYNMRTRIIPGESVELRHFLLLKIFCNSNYIIKLKNNTSFLNACGVVLNNLRCYKSLSYDNK